MPTEKKQGGPSSPKKTGAKTHSHKSSKMTSAALMDIMHSTPRSLPSIATDPFAQFRDTVKTSPFEHHSPYALGSGISAQSSLKHLQTLSNDEKKMLDLLIAPSPPKGERLGSTNPRHASPTNERKSAEEGSTEDENGATTEEDDGGAEPADLDAPNELTLTYLKILQKSEDYNRRTIKESENKNISHIHKSWVGFVRLVHHFSELFDDIENKQEAKKRDEIAVEEVGALQKIEKLHDASHQIAKRHEDIKPSCPIIAQGKTVHLGPELVNGMLAEFRWRGNIEAALNILIFDENEKLCGVASTTELVKGTDQAVAIRKFTEQGNGLSIGGSLVSFQIILANLTFRMKRAVFCVVNRSSSGNLEKLSRGWFTLRAPTDGESLSHTTKETKEVFACSVKEGGPHCGLVLGSIVRRGTGNTWIFGCENEKFIWANNAQRLSVHLSATYSQGLFGVELEAAASYERVGYQYITSFWENAFREMIAHQFEEDLQLFRGQLEDLVSEDQASRERARRRASMRFKASALDK